MMTTFYPPYNFGGDGMHAFHLTNELARRGHKVDVVHCADAYRLMTSKEPAGPSDNHPNVTVHRLHSAFGFLSPLATQQTGKPFFKTDRLKEILAQGYDVIHYHNISLVGGPKVLEYGRSIKLYTMHEYWLVCPTHILFKYNDSVCRKPACFGCTLVHKRPPQWWRYTGLLKKMIGHVDAFIAPSRFIGDKHREMGFAGPIVHLPNFATGDDAATDQGDDEPPGSPYFLYVGRLEKIKGPQTLIPFFGRYRKARLLVAGVGNYGSDLRRLARGHDNIEFLGQVGGDGLNALYRHAVAVIIPSIVFEIAPLVALEAARQKTPVVCREIGGLPEIVDSGGGGLLYRTEQELEAALDRLLEEPAYRRDLGLRAYETYLENWTADVYLERYFALIDRLAAQKNSSGATA